MKIFPIHTPNRLILSLLGIGSAATVLASGFAATATTPPSKAPMPAASATMPTPQISNETAAPTGVRNPLSDYSPPTAPVLQIGSRGQIVKDVQVKLKQDKFYTAQVDGKYGTITQQAVKSFQRSHHLTPDGIIGRQTWTVLING